jgi:transcriptional regulator with XRE-family HTH domain
MLTLRQRYDNIEATKIRNAGVDMPAQESHRFRNYVLKRMKDNGFQTQSDLAAKVGLNAPTLNRLITGKVKDPELPTFVLLAEALGDPLWRILEEAGYKVEQPTDPEASERELARQIEATPELRPIVEWLFDLDLADRVAVMTFVEILQRRRAELGQT